MKLSIITATGAALTLALAMGAPNVAMAASHGNNMMGGHMDAMHDHGHRPAMRADRRPPMPRGGHYRYQNGNWAWHGDHWDWAPGLWIKF
ncbi:MAG TPA: hypothetical protein VIJ85_07535 [Rhizomicrobium sp.]